MLWLCTCEARALLLQPFIGKGDVSIWAKNYRAGRLFVCLSGVLHSIREFFTLMIHHHYRLRASNFDQYSAHMTIEQWGFFNVPRFLCQRASVYNGHLREPVTIRIVALSSGTVTTCFYDVFFGLFRLGFEHPTSRILCKRSNRQGHRGGRAGRKISTDQ